jgi:inorganic phosphate transporter, PiT family
VDDAIIVIVVVTALAFDFTYGFHDTANAMATTIATGALPPKVAVGVAAAWALTLPAAAAIAAVAQAATDALGADSAGPVTVGLCAVAAVAALWVAQRRSPVTAEDV